MLRRFSLLCLLLGVAPALLAQDVAGSSDHPVLTRYPGSVIKWYDVQAHMPYRIAVGPVTGYRTIDDWVDTAGRVTRIYYELGGERTHGEVYANYEKALADAGFEMLVGGLETQSSQGSQPGTRKWLGVYYTANALPSSAGIRLLDGSATSGGSGFIAAKKARAAGTVYVALTVTQQAADRVGYMLDVVEVADVETDLVTVDAEAMGKDIDEYGRVALYGLYFDHDKATLTSQSNPALEEIAKLLAGRPQLAVYVVGHTDATGSFDYNRNLSEQRAQAVVATLVSDYHIAKERLEPHGVGPLSPVYSNAADAGRAKNRRVELVQR
jgi:OmpA-OmpF porin, OOP family